MTFWSLCAGSLRACSLDILQENRSAIHLVGARILIVYFEQIRVFNAGYMSRID